MEVIYHLEIGLAQLALPGVLLRSQIILQDMRITHQYRKSARLSDSHILEHVLQKSTSNLKNV